MIPIHQQRHHDPERGVLGDCMAAAVASLLHLRLEDVSELAAPDVHQGLALERFLRDHGLVLLWLRPPIMVDLRGVCHLLAGPGPRGARHVVVAVNGETIHDPHPSGAGLVEAVDYGLLVPLEPWSSPLTYWSLRSNRMSGMTEHPYQPRAPWDLHFRSHEDALDAARRALSAIVEDVRVLAGDPHHFPTNDIHRSYGKCRVEFRAVPGSRELRDYDASTVQLVETYEARVVRTVTDVEERVIDGATFSRQTEREVVMVDWATDMTPHVEASAFGKKGPWWSALFATAQKHDLRWAHMQPAEGSR